MNLTDTLSLISTVGVFCSSSFTNTTSADVNIQKNIIASNINITGGSNNFGYLYPYNMNYSLFGNTLYLRNTKVYNGNTYYYTSINSDNTYINTDFSTQQNISIVVSDVSNQLVAYSNYLQTLSQTGSKRLYNGVYTFSGNAQVNIINILSTDISNLNSATSLVFNFPINSIMLINVFGNSSVSLVNKTCTFTNNNSSGVIFNFNSNTISVQGEFDATIFAPQSTISLNNSNVYGQIICSTLINTGTNNIYSSPFIYYSSLPTLQLTQNTIINSGSLLTITNTNSSAATYYSINGGSYVLYSNPVTITTVGNFTINSYSTLLGYIDSNIATYTFTLSCTCQNPTFSYSNNIITFSSATTDAIIYFTIDGATPTSTSNSVSNNGTYQFLNDGGYDIQAYASDGICSDSGISETTVYAQYTQPNLTITIEAEQDSQGNYYDINGQGVLISISCDNSDAVIYYTIDGTDPMTYGSSYLTSFYTKAKKVKAVAYGNEIGYTNIVETPNIVIGSAYYIQPPSIVTNSPNKADEYQTYASYCLDVGWFGPTILIDDNAIYQALVNILSTSLLEIPFRPDFGTTLKNYIFENNATLTSQQIISALKAQIEYNDPRIYIDDSQSFAYFDADAYSIVINLAWRNNITNEIAMIKYGFNLDGVL